MKGAAVLPAMLVALVAAGAAQQPSPETPLYRSGTSLVPLNITVTDTKRQFVRGLTAADFAVFEDGVQQEVRFFEALDVPTDLILLIDTSSSMVAKMPVVHEAAIGFLRTLRDADRGAVVTFADGVNIVQTITSDRAQLEAAVRGTAARGGTALYNALYIALREFGQGMEVSGQIRRQAIAVLTDGEDTSSLIDFDDVMSVARTSGVTVYPIALQSRPATTHALSQGQGRNVSAADYSLRALARESGAQAFFPQAIEELKGIYGVIAQELSSQYSIAYSSANNLADGHYRRINVTVADRPELRLRTRAGYTAARARTSARSMARPEH